MVRTRKALYNFESNCRGVKAKYDTLEDGTVSITNECLWNDKMYRVEGNASLMYPGTDLAAFFVDYPWVPRGGYFIIYAENIDNKNGIAFVSGRNFSYFWILTRNKNYDKTRVCHLLRKMKLPVDYNKLIWNDGEKCFAHE